MIFANFYIRVSPFNCFKFELAISVVHPLNLLFPISCLSSPESISCLRSSVSCLWSSVSHLLFPVSWTVSHLLSLVFWPVSHLLSLVSHLLYPVFRLLCHPSPSLAIPHYPSLPVSLTIPHPPSPSLIIPHPSPPLIAHLPSSSLTIPSHP